MDKNIEAINENRRKVVNYLLKLVNIDIDYKLKNSMNKII